jgi:hypothetical protein
MSALPCRLFYVGSPARRLNWSEPVSRA